jgi:hypothetical protein
MTYSITYTPRLRVTIKAANGNMILDNIEKDIISLATNKAYGRANGTWQMLLTYRIVRDGKRYHEIIRSDDIITIELDPGNGKGFSPVMMGLVDRVARTRQGGQDAIVQHVKVSGQDMGKLFIKHDIAWDIVKYEQDLASSRFNQIFIPNQTGGTKQYATVSRLFDPRLQTGTAAEMVESLFTVCFRDVLAPVAPYFTIDTTSAAKEDKWEINQPNMLTAQGISIWEVMKRASHFPWNMLHCDTDIDKVGLFNLILERQPIDDNGKLARDGKRLHVIEDHEIVADDLGINDSERVNFLFYYPAMYQYATNYVADVAMVHPDLARYDKDTDGNGIPRHGYCSHVINDYFVPPTVDSSNEKEALTKFGQLTKNRTETFWQWYRRNHELESGTITVHGRPDIRAGHGLLVRQGQTREYKEYLIEQVAHQYDVWPTPRFSTVLHVTRGQEAPLAKIDEARRLRR